MEENELGWGDDEMRKTRCLLHQSTMSLRDGMGMDIEQVLDDVQKEVEFVLNSRSGNT